jgi:hypothetical protein
MQKLKLVLVAPFAAAAIIAACGGDKPTPPVSPDSVSEAGASDMPASTDTAASTASAAPTDTAMAAPSASAAPADTSMASASTDSSMDAGAADAGKKGKKKKGK